MKAASGESLARSAISFLRSVCVDGNACDGSIEAVGDRWEVVLPPGQVASTVLSDMSQEVRLRQLLELARFLNQASRQELLWLDLSPDLLWAGSDGFLPLAVWRVTRTGILEGSLQPWSSSCSPPECALARPAVESSPLFAWAKLVQQLMSGVSLPPVWTVVLDACLRPDPAERQASLEDLFEELSASIHSRPEPSAISSTLVCVAGASDRGPLRADQEDRWVAWSTENFERGFAAVADGMGGGVLGGLAAEWALDSLLGGLTNAAPGTLPEAAEKALLSTSQRIQRFREAIGLLETMGTTLVALVWDGPARTVVHAGDSRAYRATNQPSLSFAAMTRDHAPVRDGAAAGGVTNALDGGDSRVEVTPLMGLPDGEVWLLCSDGFWCPAEAVNLLGGMLQDDLVPDRLLTTMRAAEEERLELIQTADNATVVLVRFVAQIPQETVA